MAENAGANHTHRARCNLASIFGGLRAIVRRSAVTWSAVAPNVNMLFSPIACSISMFAPSIVPTIKPPFMTNFMFPVPLASIPAVEMCCETSLAGMSISAVETL